MAKKVVEIDIETAQAAPSSAAFGVHVLARLKEVGIPAFGSLWPIAVTYGTLISRVEYDPLTGYRIIYEWRTKRGEVDPGDIEEGLFSGQGGEEEGDEL